MPWLSIIMAIISALASLKKSPEKKGQAVAAAALGGLGTYYVTHETEWGKDTLGALDGVTPTSIVTPNADGTTATVKSDGETTIVPLSSIKALSDGSMVLKSASSTPSATTGVTTGITEVLKSWGPTGTAAVIGTTAVATSPKLNQYLPWIAGGLILLLLLK